MVTTVGESTDPGMSREDQAEAFARNAIAGHPQGAVRRIVLWVVMFGSMGGGILHAEFLLIAIVAGILLAMTDDLV
jgi:hypothetical protein